MAKCEQCIYYPHCDEYPFDESGCKDFKDKSRFVELPCKIGDTVWTIRRFHDKKCATSGIVSEMFFTQQMKLEIVVKCVARGEWGKKVFATREEAEAALERKMNDA